MDSIVYEISQSSGASDQSIFLQKNWISILDNNNNSYSSGQVTIDTSQLSNSNRWMNYREAYLSVPLLLTASCSNDPLWASAGNSADYAFGLKNNYASVIHSLSVDLQGSTVVQTTPFISLVNNFRLVTTFSFQDLLTLGPSIGFYPDTSVSFEQNTSASRSGLGTCNNRNLALIPIVSGVFNSQESFNRGLYERQRWWNYDPDASTGDAIAGSVAFSALADSNRCNIMYKSYINRKTSGASGTNIWQASISATIFLRHLHPLYDRLPMCKGLFQKITLNLNQPVVSAATALPAITASATFNITGALTATTALLTVTAIAVAGNFLTVGCSFPNAGNTFTATIISQVTVAVGSVAGQLGTYKVSVCGTAVAADIVSGTLVVSPPALVGSSSTMALATVNVPSGGLSPIMLASSGLGNGSSNLVPGTYTVSLSVGNVVTAASQVLPANSSGPLSRSIVLNVPSYVMNPMVESAYISQSIKSVEYSDYYQYLVQNVAGGGSGNINALITNGISGLKSCLVIPVFNSAGNNAVNPLLSPYDPCGGGSTSPLAHISNFNILVSGQNAIYQNQSYTYQAFLNQLSGQNSVNFAQIDGASSSLVSQADFENSYCYYYVDIARGLPVESSVPKSVVFVGTNNSIYACDYYVFLEYSARMSLSIISGSRVA